MPRSGLASVWPTDPPNYPERENAALLSEPVCHDRPASKHGDLAQDATAVYVRLREESAARILYFQTASSPRTATSFRQSGQLMDSAAGARLSPAQPKAFPIRLG